MSTAGERPTELSPLGAATAAEHLKAIADASGVAGVLLVAFSGLDDGTAAEHLLADGDAGAPPAPPPAPPLARPALQMPARDEGRRRRRRTPVVLVVRPTDADAEDVLVLIGVL